MSNHPPATSNERLRVIVVDDDDGARKALQSIIESLGHECRSALDGVEALVLHEADAADVIISDWVMGSMNGPELCRRVRLGDRDARYTYFVLLTALGDRAHFLEGMNAGADDYQQKPVDIDALRVRLEAAERLVRRYHKLETTNSDLKRDSQRAAKLARLDSLTGVANRLRMEEDLATAWATAKRYARTYSLAVIDVDHFKIFNDTFGHQAGDGALCEVTEAIRMALRQSDGLYRYGGEEFLVLLPEQALEDARLALERVKNRVEARGIPAPSGTVTVSIGVAELRATDTSVATWLRRADAALYSAKKAGRNRVESDTAA